jgi:hypothetical protein
VTARYFADAGALRWRQFDDGVVVHDRRHSRTHLLPAATGVVLQVVLAAPNGCAADDIGVAFGVNPRDCPSEGTALEGNDEWGALKLMMSELVRLRLTELRSA